MKRLILIRHAKSSWDSQHGSDRERPLNKRGERNAPDMGKRLARRGIRPGLILSSPAVRAITTAQILAHELGYPREKIVEVDDLYGADVRDFIEIIAHHGGGEESVMLFSHNPGITGLVHFLTGERIANVPTCGVAIIDFDLIQWEEIDKGAGQLVDFDYPKKKPAD